LALGLTQANIRPDWKGFPGTNTLAYVVSLSLTKTLFIAMRTGGKITKAFFFVMVAK